MSRCKFCNVRIPHNRFLNTVYTNFCSETCHHYYNLFESFILNKPFKLDTKRHEDIFVETILIKSEKQRLGLLTTKDLEELQPILEKCVDKQFSEAVRKKRRRRN